MFCIFLIRLTAVMSRQTVVKSNEEKNNKLNNILMTVLKLLIS